MSWAHGIPASGNAWKNRRPKPPRAKVKYNKTPAADKSEIFLSTRPSGISYTRAPTPIQPIHKPRRRRFFDSHSALSRAHSRSLPRHSRPLYPRHSRESGNPDDCSQVRHPKSSTNPNQRIPSPFMDLQAQVDAEFSETIVAPPLKIAPRHSRESGNPRRLQSSSPPEIRYKSQPADPFSLYGLTGVGLAFRRSGGHRNLWRRGEGEPSQSSEIKYE